MGLCERCKKAKATFHLTNIDRSGTKVTRNLCDRCAGEEGLLQTPKSTIDLNEVLESFIAGGKATTAEVSNLVCEHCGISYVEFRNQGLLGCAHDYDVFKEQITKLLERTHDGATHHIGKAPRSQGAARKPQQDLRRLRRQLEEAVAAEDYERAAELRDRMRALEGP
ncbi:MAG: UvrB/UvrC motif-containing protein [Phycisphaerales bacterium]|nr:UvrB/UvrC motif-containing protein [Phycisphaerales bacterium]